MTYPDPVHEAEAAGTGASRERGRPARNGGPKARRKAARTKRPCPRARHAPFPGPGTGHCESGAGVPGRDAVRAPFISAPHEPGAVRD